MLRRSVTYTPSSSCVAVTTAAAATTTTSSATLTSAIREVRATTLSETLKPAPGTNQGTWSLRTQVSIASDKDNEAKWPAYRNEVMPSSPSLQRGKRDERSHSYLSSVYKWGYNSLSLFHHLNELPGNWSNANDTSFMTDYSTAGEFAACGLHSGIWLHAKGSGMFNTKPSRLRGWAFGSKLDKSKGGVKIHYGSTLVDAGQKNEKVQKLMFPHTAEHTKHKRLKNPALPGFSEITEPAHGKRIQRECQYHLGQGIRQYLIDGYFGSHPGTATSFRIFTDNADHAYVASMNAVRNKNITHYNGEHQLQVTSETSPLDEWVWRRPSVLVYHCPSFDFEAPRIVEEFGGPRPQDMSLKTQAFQVVEPYSIPMKAMIGAVPDSNTLFDTIGFLAARWGFYADERHLLTLPHSESVVSANNDALTVVVNTKRLDVSAIRQSPFLYGSRHHRLGNGLVSRAWDGTELPPPSKSSSSSSSTTTKYDLLDEENNTLHRPLPTRVGPQQSAASFSHRYDNKTRGYSGISYKFPHNYECDAKARASSGGMLFNNNNGGGGKKQQQEQQQQPQHFGRPSAFNLKSVKFVIVGEGKDAAKSVVEAISKNSFLYAEEAPLLDEFKSVLASAGSVQIVPQSEAQNVINKLAKSGSA